LRLPTQGLIATKPEDPSVHVRYARYARDTLKDVMQSQQLFESAIMLEPQDPAVSSLRCLSRAARAAAVASGKMWAAGDGGLGGGGGQC
jgi:hypothetical protein